MDETTDADDTEPIRTKRDKIVEEQMEKILENEDSPQALRDFAQTRLADRVGMGTVELFHSVSDEIAGNWSLPNPGLYPLGSKEREQAEDWLLAEAFELGVAALIEPHDALAAASRALVADETKIPLRSERSWDGSTHPDYPKLTAEAKRILKESNHDHPLQPDAHVFLGFMNISKPNSALDHFSKASSARPRDWRLRILVSTMLAGSGNMSMALEQLCIAEDYVCGDNADFEKWLIAMNKGKLLANMNKADAAIEVLERALGKYDEYCTHPSMNERNIGHIAVAQFVLCMQYVISNMPRAAKRHYKSAEEKIESIDERVANSLNLESRMTSQLLMSTMYPSLMNVGECSNCKKATDKNLWCSKCEVAKYCSKACQTEAWYGGHKKECKLLRQERKSDKQERKLRGKDIASNEKMAQQLSPIDIDLIPSKLWKSAVSLAKKGDPESLKEAAWKFLVALFMDFSLDGYDMNPVVIASDAGAEDDDPVALALSIATFFSKHGKEKASTRFNEHAETVLKKLHSLDHRLKEPCIAESVDEVDRRSFSIGVANIFYARILTRSATSSNTMTSALDPRNREMVRAAEKLIDEAKYRIDPTRWLTMQFELGYSNFDVAAAEEADFWLSKLVKGLEEERSKKGALSKHWRNFKVKAEQKLRMVPSLRNALRTGTVSPFL